MCVHVRTCAHACVISEISTLFRVYAISLSTHTLYTCRIALFFPCGTILIFLYPQVTCRHVERPIASLITCRKEQENMLIFVII